MDVFLLIEGGRPDCGLSSAFLHFVKGIIPILFSRSKPRRSPQLQANRVHGTTEASEEKDVNTAATQLGPVSLTEMQGEITVESWPSLTKNCSPPATVGQFPASQLAASTLAQASAEVGWTPDLQGTGHQEAWFQGKDGGLGDHAYPS